MDRSVAIANEFLRKLGGTLLTQMQLQKLVYFAHGWNLAVNGEPLTAEEPQAWAYGPVYPDLYEHTKPFGSSPIGRPITPNDSNAARHFGSSAEALPYAAHLTPQQRVVIDHVWNRYGRVPGSHLSALTHQVGTPWSQVYQTGSGKNRTIPNELIQQHYRQIAERVGQPH